MKIVAKLDCASRLKAPRLVHAVSLTLLLAGIAPAAVTPAVAAPMADAPMAAAPDGQYNLADYGPIATAAQAGTALDRAEADILAKGGGILVVPPNAPADWEIENDAPSSTQPGSPAVTIVDRRGGYERILLPSNGRRTGNVWSGLHLGRTVNQPIDMAMGEHPTENIETNIAGGTASYDEPILFAATAGKNQRVYVNKIRGLAQGMRILITSSPLGYGNPVERLTIKALGWDAQKQLNYVVLDLEHDHPARALLYDKHVVNSLTVTDHSNSDNQSMGIMASRHNYGEGDSFVVSSSIVSQGNVMSGAGDEGGLAYGADISNDLRPFRSTVESIDWSKQELVYAPGAVRNFTLGTSRPIINLNPAKWITSGHVWIVAPNSSDPWDPNNPIKTGKEYNGEAFSGGAIFGSRDCGWTPDIVGRFFAIDEPSEYLDPANDPAAGYTSAPDMRVYRWYVIQKLENRPDGTMRLYVERTRWWTRNDVVPNLYDADNYTWTGHERPLRYIVAPGNYVSDISRAWTNSEGSDGFVQASSPRILKLAPNGDAGTRFDYAKGDKIAQAIGSDPWNPTGMRVRHHNYLPSTIDDSSFQSVNAGRVTVGSVLSVGGGHGDLESDIRETKDKSPKFGEIVDIGATSGVGVNFRADVAEAAIEFQQPHNRAQPIVWDVNGAPTHSLTVDPQRGGFDFKGGELHATGLMLQGGLSAGDKPANNLRGVNVAVPPAATQLKVTFERPEADADYAIVLQPNWMTLSAVRDKSATGFTITFGAPAPAASLIDWMLVR